MPDLTLQGGMRLFIPNRHEIGETVAEEIGKAQRAAARAWKHMDLPQTLRGTPASSAITLGPGSGQYCGPESGYVWSVRRLVVSGLTAGASPDIVNLYKNDQFLNVPLWQFNGNNFGYGWGRNELTLRGGESFSLQNSGTIAATGLIILGGEVDEVPEEKWRELG